MSSSSSSDFHHMSGEEYLKFLVLPYEEIKSATNNFSNANLIAQGSAYDVYKGQLLISDGQLINIVARTRLQNFKIHETATELSVSQYLNHKNISSIFKIAVGDESLIMINEHEANGSLDKHLRGSTLTWMQRIKICLGVAHALSYLHNHNFEGDHYFIHGNIKSSKILLDDNWEPKLHGFRYAQRVKKTHAYFIRKHDATVQYMDPAYENTNTLTYKSDVFSLGVVLFEVLFGTKAFIQNGDNWYFARLARLHYQETTLDHMIHPDLRKQMDLQSLKIFSEVAYCCLKEQRGERPDMDQIVVRLKKALELQQEHETPKEHLTPAIGATSSNYLEGKNLDHLKIRLRDIEFATNKFSIANCIGQGGYGRVYKAVLDHFDSTKSLATEGNNKGDFSKRRNTVAIKRLFSRQDGQDEQGFFTEIEMLANCKHPNIVSLLGFCEEGLEWILIYEYVTNGSLSDYLGNVNNMTNLTWARRIQICLDIANGLNYLHTSTQKKPVIIHRDIKSDNILLDHNWVAKIADFGLSKLVPAHLKASTINTNVAGTEVYLDPEYMKTGKLKKESDIYSFGVVLFEILCGRLAYDECYNFKNEKGLSSTVRRCFSEGTLKDLVDPKLKETHENNFGLNGGLNQDSLDTFMNIAYQCLANTQTDRPTTKVIIEELKKALDFQKNNKDNRQISLRDIKLATRNFSDDMCTREGRYWKKYEGEITHANVCTTIVAKRFDSKSTIGHRQFLLELNALSEYKHGNIVALVGYCNELDENVIEFEHATNGSLDKHLDNGSLSWMKRLKICIDIASGLEFLNSKRVSHHDIKSASILVDGDWKAKISNLELLSNFLEYDKEIEFDTSSLSYVDPLYKQKGYLTWASDTYSLGVVLIEILSGRLASSFEESLGDLVQKCKESAEDLDKLVFEDIKQHCAPHSLTTYFELATECLDLHDTYRPNASDVVIKLKKALELQEDYEIWEPKLPKDYEQIILMSNTPKIYSNEKKKDLYEMLTKGILLQQGKLWFVLGGNGENNVMISATKFSYKNWCPYRWLSLLPQSRFRKVAQMLDISNLMIKIMTRPQLLSPNVVYGVHLVFKFCDSRDFSSKPMYVNLKYKKGNETLHTYFATWRDDEWMMIELYRFLNQSEDVVLKFLLESLSLYNCGDDSIYVEGIEFRAINNVEQKDKELKEEEQVLKLTSNMVQVQQMPIKSEEIFKRSENYDIAEKMFLSKVKGKKHLVFSSKGSLYDFSDLKCFNSKPSAESRFQEVIELLPQPVFCINCTIKSQMLSQDTHAYACYLVFKLSEKCQGLHCPVEVRDLLREKKDAEIIYLKSPSPWNIHDITRVPTQREDGWMEVQVWKINNSQHEVKNSCIPIKLKFISYEGTFSGLIICGLEFCSM